MEATEKSLPKVLIVEDDDALARMLKKVVSTIADPDLAYDGEEALGILKTSATDYRLVLTDVAMPRMDGHTLAKEMKKEKRLQMIPVIMLTAKAGPTDVVAGINSGARFYLTKPFQQDDLLAKIKKALGLK
ncbi:MAG: response regulator transcription factor [Polyangiales bacterium]